MICSSSVLIVINSLLILVAALLFGYLVDMKTPEMATTEALSQELRNNPIDPNSFARPDLVRVTHHDLRWKVNFESKTIQGHVLMTVSRIRDEATSLNLDALDLTIFGVFRVTDDVQRTPIPYRLQPPVPGMGSKLEVDISSIKESEFRIRIDYATSEQSRALMWMAPSMTAGKKHPFMYSQCQAINARAMVPCQDTPSVKASYAAQVVAPASLRVLMSAKIVRDPEPGPNHTRTHWFEQRVPIQSYLIAIAVGDLLSRPIGPISHVWAEPSVLEQAAWEFEPTNKFLEVAQQLAGPYVWGIYDILMLPPSFPYGGMENPCLTFATPTIVAGDRSLVDVIAHEIAHSWTGNLVTNANFGHFWLNEGFTMFLERKILGRVHGEPTRQFSALEGIRELRDTVRYYGDTNPFTKLLIDVRGIDPDEVFSIVPYEKGHTFLYYLEQRVGGPAVFEPFLKAYIEHFKYQSIVTDDFRRFFIDYFKEKERALADIDWETWLHTPGMPPVIPDYDQTLLKASVDLATKWLEATDPTPAQFDFSEFDSLSSAQRKLFFMELTEQLDQSKGRAMHEKLAVMVKQYRIGDSKNCELQYAWLRLALKARFEPAVPDTVRFLSTYGRMKYIKPLYRALYQWDKTKQLALDTFKANQPHMMRVAIDAVAQDLK